jgi:hypothetical protein
MNEKMLTMSEVVQRENPDFSIEYRFLDDAKIKQFPGILFTFSYTKTPSYDEMFCDIFPEFKKKSSSNELVGMNQIIPSSGRADMWIVSNRNKAFHLAKLIRGRKCYLMNGERLMAICTVKKVMAGRKVQKIRALQSI